MKVTLELDTELRKYIEYIPSDDLPGILVNLIKEAIAGRSSVQSSETSSTEDIRKLSELLEGISKGQISVPKKQEVIEEKEESKQKTTVISTADISSDDLDFDMDLLSMMK